MPIGRKGYGGRERDHWDRWCGWAPSGNGVGAAQWTRMAAPGHRDEKQPYRYRPGAQLRSLHLTPPPSFLPPAITTNNVYRSQGAHSPDS
eukprot:scaffold3643_cov267-Pinguiococcus_pyrenoidosus.AAC.9